MTQTPALTSLSAHNLHIPHLKKINLEILTPLPLSAEV